MNKWIAIMIFALIGIMDTMLVISCGKKEKKFEQHTFEPPKQRTFPSDYKGCDNCYYELFDSECFPCSMCIRGIERKDMWRENG